MRIIITHECECGGKTKYLYDLNVIDDNEVKIDFSLQCWGIVLECDDCNKTCPIADIDAYEDDCRGLGGNFGYGGENIMETVITKDEIATIISIGNYWEEVIRRDDSSPLHHELRVLIQLFGIKILFLTLEGARAIESAKPI